MVLGHLDRPAIAARISELLGTVCPEPLAKLMYEQTAGLPVLLDQLVTGLRDSGQLSADAVRQLAPRARLDVPAGVREQLRYVIEALPAEVRNLLFAATLSTGNDTGTLSRLLELDGPLLLRLTPATYTNQVCDRLARLHLDRGGSMLAAGQALLRASGHGPQVATVLQAAADEALGASPELASRLFAAAVTAGARSPGLLTGRADAAARCGRFDEALRLADEALTEPGTDDARARARALGITAAVLAHRGLLGRAGQLYRLAGADGAG